MGRLRQTRLSNLVSGGDKLASELTTLNYLFLQPVLSVRERGVQRQELLSCWYKQTLLLWHTPGDQEGPVCAHGRPLSSPTQPLGAQAGESSTPGEVGEMIREVNEM